MTIKPDHIDRTAHEPRYQFAFNAYITQLTQATPTVKRIQLHIDQVDNTDIDNINFTQSHSVTASDAKFTFEAGQWVDVHIPGVHTIGGYSITSTPYQLQHDGTIDLHIKYSKHAPAHWCHTVAHVDSAVKLRVGGSFIYSHHIDSNEHRKNVVFVAGGVGVNTVYAMLCVRMRVLQQIHGSSTKDMPHTTFLYTAKSMNELLFHSELQQLAEQYGDKLTYKFALTSPQSTNRITVDQIVQHLVQPYNTNIVYICGPPRMTDTLVAQIKTVDGITDKQIMYEKWW